MLRIIVAAVLGGILMFAWGSVSWVALPFHLQTLRALPNEDALVAEIQRGAVATGTYAYPARRDDAEAWAESMKAGPVGYVTHFADGEDPNNPVTFLRGFGLAVLRCLVGGLLLCAANLGLPTYWHRVLFVTGLGLVSALVHAGAGAWGMATADRVALMAIDELVSWFLAGLAIAALVKSRSPASGKAATLPSHDAPAA